MTKAFPLFLWKNSPSVETPLSENLLNTINIALSEVDDRVVTHDKTKANQSDLLTTLSDVSYNEKTGIITFTKKNGAKLQIDTKLEKLAVNFTYDKTNQRLVITLEDGTIQYVDMKSLITQFEFVNSDSVIFLVGTDGKVTATIAKGGISADMIEPNYLANVQLYAEQAENSMSSANTNAVASKSYAVGGTNTRPGEDTDNAKYYAELAKAIAVFDVESLIDGTIVVGKAKDADTLDGKHAEDFLSSNGGTVNGNIFIDRDTKGGIFGSVRTQNDGTRARAQFWSGVSKDVFIGILNHEDSTEIASLVINAEKVNYRNNAGTVEVLHSGNVENYALSVNGGKLSGNVSIESAQAVSLFYKLKNSLRECNITTNADGRFGVYDATNGKWILVSSLDGTTTLNGTSSGNLPLTGGEVASGKASVLSVHRTNGTNVWTGYKGNNESLGYIGFSGVNNPVYTSADGAKINSLHHDGNSAKVVKADSAPADNTALWIDTANKKTKAYIDGAWTVV